MSKRKKIDADSLAQDALRLRGFSKALENRGFILAGDPRYLDQIGSMQRELDRLRGSKADFVEGDTCLIHPADVERTLCGDTVRPSIDVTHKAHKVSCAPCLRTMLDCVRAYYGIKQAQKSA